VLAHLMVAAGMRLDGVVLHVAGARLQLELRRFAPATLSCEGFLPSYGLTGAWFGRTNPVPSDADAYAGQLRDFAATTYGPAATAWVQTHTPARAGAPRPARRPHRRAARRVDRQRRPRPEHLPQPPAAGQLLGRYDARIAAPLRQPARAQGDPSSTLINAPFAAAAKSRFVDELHYVASATYATAIERDQQLELQPRRPRPARHRARSRGGADAVADAARAVDLRLSRPGDAVSPDRARPGADRRSGARRDSRLSRRAHDVSRRRLATADPATTSRLAARAGDGGDDARRVRRRARARAAPGRRARRRRRSAPPRAPLPRRRLARPRISCRRAIPTCRRRCASRRPSARPKARRSKALVERKIAERRADPWR
jgi:hypothetical protein